VGLNILPWGISPNSFRFEWNILALVFTRSNIPTSRPESTRKRQMIDIGTFLRRFTFVLFCSKSDCVRVFWSSLKSPHSEPSRRSADLWRHFRPSRCSLLSRSDVDCELQRGRRSCMGFYGFVPLFVPTAPATMYPCRRRARCRSVIDKLTRYIYL